MRRFYLVILTLLRPIAAILYPTTVRGREHVPDGACILCANHSSYTDPVLLGLALGSGTYTRFMAKAELRRVPVLGWILKNCGCIFVNRGKSDVNAIRESMKCLRGGDKLSIFPEGTRVFEDNAADAKTGAVRLASRLRVPIVPVYISRGKRMFHRAQVHIGEPYRVEGRDHEDYARLSGELMERICQLEHTET